MEDCPYHLHESSINPVITVILIGIGHEVEHAHQRIHHVTVGFVVLLDCTELLALVIELHLEHVILLVRIDEPLIQQFF
jgi:hypothetical protein